MRIITRESTQINREPRSVIAHNGMLSKNPTLSIVVTISLGRVVAVRADGPEENMMVDTIP